MATDPTKSTFRVRLQEIRQQNYELTMAYV